MKFYASIYIYIKCRRLRFLFFLAILKFRHFSRTSWSIIFSLFFISRLPIMEDLYAELFYTLSKFKTDFRNKFSELNYMSGISLNFYQNISNICSEYTLLKYYSNHTWKYRRSRVWNSWNILQTKFSRDKNIMYNYCTSLI